MYEVSQEWSTGITADARDIRARIVLDGSTVLTDDEEIVSIKIIRACNTESRFFGNAISSQMEVLIYESVKTESIAAGMAVQAFFSLANAPSEQVPAVPMRISKAERDPDAGTVKLTAYDALYVADAYAADQISGIAYPLSLSDYAAAAAGVFGITLADTTWYHAGLELSAPPNLSGSETVREVIARIAEAAFCNAVIDRAGRLAFTDMRGKDAVPYTIDAEQYYECTVGEESGPYNTLVLARLPQEDNIYREDEEAVAADGRKEIKIADNPFLDSIRDDVIDEMLTAVDGVRFYAVKMEWRGNPALDMGDRIMMASAEEEQYGTFYGSETLSYDGGLRCTGETLALTETETAYKKASSIKDTIRRTELAVDKVNGEIAGIAERVDTEITAVGEQIETVRAEFSATANEITQQVSNQSEQIDRISGNVESVEEQLASLSVTVDGVSAQTQHRGGANLLKGTAAYGLDNWEADEGVSLSRGGAYASDVRQHSAAGGGFVLPTGTRLAQTVTTIPDGQYCWMLRYKLTGSGAQAGAVTVGAAETALPPVSEWTQVRGNLTASGTAMDFAVECTAGTLLIADMILMPGLEVSDWQQAQNEIMTDGMTFANGVLSIGAGGEKLSTRIDNASFAVKNNAANKYEAFFDENGSEFGKTTVRGSLTVDPEARAKGLVTTPDGTGHVMFTVND